jgi:hypothetical protein
VGNIEPFPTFSWSHSRARTLAACAREYYWRYYGSHNGWLADAPHPAQVAYRLKQLTSFDLVLGSAIHSGATEIATALRDQLVPPSRESLEAAVRHELNDLYRRSQDLRTFKIRPRLHPVAHCFYYGSGFSKARRAKLEEKLGSCLDHLVSAPVWDEIREAGPGAIRIVDEVGQFTLDVWAAPDLIFLDEDGVWNLIDWKTGRTLLDVEQLGVYALYAREVLDVDPPYRGRLIGLLDDRHITHEVTVAALEAVEARIYDSVRLMETYLVDVEANQPFALEDFPLAEDRRRCRRCNFYQLCRRELEE